MREAYRFAYGTQTCVNTTVFNSWQDRKRTVSNYSQTIGVESLACLSVAGLLADAADQSLMIQMLFLQPNLKPLGFPSLNHASVIEKCALNTCLTVFPRTLKHFFYSKLLYKIGLGHTVYMLTVTCLLKLYLSPFHYGKDYYVNTYDN